MPATNHLQWTEIKEFGGLWTAGAASLMPANRAQVMSGCHPQPGGGLRAFLKVASTIPGTGLSSGGTADVAAGFGIAEKAAMTTVTEPTFLIVSVDEGVSPLTDWQLWRWEKDEGAAAWSRSTGAAFAGATSYYSSPPPAQPAFIRIGGWTDPDVTMQHVLSLAIREYGDGTYGSGTQSGLYEVDVNTGTVTRNTTSFANEHGAVGLVEHQARMVAGYNDLLKYSTTGGKVFQASIGTPVTGAGIIRLNPLGWLTPGGLTVTSELPLIAWMVSVPPGDLIVATRDGRIYNIQGDLADPTIRELGRWTTMLPHAPANTPNGIFFILPNQGVARLGLDGSVDVVSTGILPAVWNLTPPKVGLGQIAGTERYVFCPNQHTTVAHKNGALVFDIETGAWFTSTHSDDYSIPNPKFMQPDNNPRNSGIWVVSGAAPATQGTSLPWIFHYRTGGYDSASVTTEARANTWEFKSAPLREPGNQYLDVHEVQVPAYAFNNNTSTLAVTVGGVTITRTLPSGRSLQRFFFKAKGADLDVNVKAKSNDTAVEAPMIDALRIGWIPGHML